MKRSYRRFERLNLCNDNELRFGGGAPDRGDAASVLPLPEALRGVQRSQLARLKEPEKENQRLRRAVSNLTLDKLILAEAAKDEGSSAQTLRTLLPESTMFETS